MGFALPQLHATSAGLKAISAGISNNGIEVLNLSKFLVFFRDMLVIYRCVVSNLYVCVCL